MNVLIVTCPLSLFTYAAFFRKLPSMERTPIGFLYCLIWLYIPQILSRLDRRFTGGRVVRSALQLSQYVAYEKRPTLLIFFLSLLSGCAALFIPATWPLVSRYHKFTITILLPLPYIFAYFCNKTGPDAPHIISPASYAQNASRYPYDYKLFHPNMNCKTCQFPKPARSKHCSLCRACVARADHHCVWVNNCLGRGNYKYFLALLLSTTSLLAYTAQLAYLTVAPQVNDHFTRYPIQQAKLSVPLLTNAVDDGRGWRSDQVLVLISGFLNTFNTALILGGIARSGVGLLALITAPLPAGLLAYHAYLVWAGMTTNESVKWNNWRAELADGSGYIAPIVDNDESSQCASHRWPKRSRQILVRTSDGLPPRNLQPEIKAVVGEHAEWRWRRSLNEVDNVYDLGPWRNLMDLLLD